MKISMISMVPGIHNPGLRIISACLKQAGHDATLFFLMKEYHKKYSETAMNNLVELTKGSDMVGISVMTNFFDNAIHITQKLRNNYDFPILWGGIHPTIRSEESLDHADMICLGESEETIVELADKIQNKQYYYDIKGMGFNNKGKKIVNGLRPQPGSKNAAIIKSLDQVPFPDYDYRSHFILKGENIVRMDLELMKQIADAYQTLPTRGCPYKCTYCINNIYHEIYPHQKPIRKRSVDNIIGELLEIKNKLPFIEIILFNDDAFFLMSADEIKELSKRYKEQIGLPLWIIGATPSTLTKEKLSPLVDAGLVEVGIGIQSVSEGAKKLYIRPHSNQKIANAARLVNEYRDQVKAAYDIILDSPWETDEDLTETLMFLSKLPTPYQLSIYSLVFFPGTELYEKAKKEGIIKDDLNDVYRKYYRGCTNTHLNKLFFLLNDYTMMGIGISPIIMFILTHKITKKLYLHKFLRNIIRALRPFFRYIGRSTRPSTRLYQFGNVVKFRGRKTTYRAHAQNEFDMKVDLREFHSEDLVARPPWLVRKFKKMKPMFSKLIADLKTRGS
jgi:radical SAM superfamily enzyme YgiQ (UPF0313 family)